MRLTPISGADAAQALFGGRSTLVLGLALFVTLALARAVIVTGLGDQMIEDKPQGALALGHDTPEALASAGLNAWQAKDFTHASKLSLAALDRSPLNVHALRVRGLALDGLGKKDKAQAVMQFAGTRGWRDDGVQSWLLRDEIINHQFDLAYLHADAMARRRQDLWPTLFLLFEVSAANEQSARAVVERLDARPNWRSSFFVRLASSKQKDPPTEHMFQMVDQGPQPLTGEELSDYPLRLAREGRYRDALAELRSYRNGRALAGSPFDGGFTDKPGAPPFAWEKLGKSGASLDMDPAPGRTGSNALRVEYDGYSATDLMRQALAPAPGDYVLSGESFPEQGDPHLVGWQVRCIADGRVLASAYPDENAPPNAWRRFAVRFNVPAQNCDGVWLALVETPQDHSSSNAAWFANLAVQPASPAVTAK